MTIPPVGSNQGHRLELAKGKNVLVVCVGVDWSKIIHFERAKESLGVNFFCLEDPANILAVEMHEKGLWTHIRCKEIFSVSPTSEDYISRILGRLQSEMKQLNVEDIDGVITIWDDAVGLAARIAKAIGVHANTVESVDIAHDKYLTRQRLRQHGLPCPRGHLISEDKEDVGGNKVIEKVKDLVFPVIVKPAAAGSSIGVRKVTDLADIVKEYKTCLGVIHDALKDRELMGLDIRAHQSTDILIEEFLEGPEVDVDLVLHKGQTLYAQVMDDWEYESPWFCELGCHFPSKHPEDTRKTFIRCAEQVARAVGITESVHHIEFILDKTRGPTLVEINPRMGGGPVNNFHRAAYGMDLFEEVIFHCLGIAHIPRNEPYPKEGPSNALVNCVTFVGHARKSGVIQNDVEEALRPIREYKEVMHAAAMSRKGETVTGWDDGFPTDMTRMDMQSKELSIDELIILGKRYVSEFLSSVDIQ